MSERYQSDGLKELVISGGFSDPLKLWSSLSRDVTNLASDHEEADTRMILHGRDAAQRGYQQINVHSRDTDVLVLLIAHFPSLCRHVWMFTGTSRKRKYIAIHKVTISDECRSSLLAFHAITGCDTTSQFAGIGKITAWNVFTSCPNLLGSIGVDCTLTQEGISNAEAFVCQLYDKGTDVVLIDKTHFRLTSPTHDALHLHIKRAHFQTLVWNKALEPRPILPSPDGNGWVYKDGVLTPQLMTKAAVSPACLELAFCGCSVGDTCCATRRCKCVRLELNCSKACKCGDACHNISEF